MRVFSAITAAVMLLVAGCDSQPNTAHYRGAKPQGRRIVTLSADDIERLGIEATPAQAAQYTPQIHGYGIVVNSTPLAQFDAAIMKAHAAQMQSDAALDRARKLFGKVNADRAISREALEAAQRQAGSDAADTALADRTEAAAFGQGAPWRGAVRDNALLARLMSGRSVLIETTFPLGAGLDTVPPALTVAHLRGQSNSAVTSASKIWNAPADPTIPGEVIMLSWTTAISNRASMCWRSPPSANSSAAYA